MPWSESHISLKCYGKYFSEYSLNFKWMIVENKIQQLFTDFFLFFLNPISNFQLTQIEISIIILWNFNKYFHKYIFKKYSLKFYEILISFKININWSSTCTVHGISMTNQENVRRLSIVSFRGSYPFGPASC